MNTRVSTQNAIVVLGYSLNEDGALHPLLITRLTEALSLYQPGVPIIVAGNMPPVQINPKRYEKMTEAEAMKGFLIKNGVASNDIFMERFSLTTFLNAYYTRLLHIDPVGINKIQVVSNAFHMPLVKYCFTLVFGNTVTLDFINASDEGANFKEIADWSQIIIKMTNELYPILFNNVQPGDLKAIYSIVNAAYIVPPNEQRKRFESQLRICLSLDETVLLQGVI